MSMILVVEDDPGVRSLLKRALTGEGYSVIEAQNGREGRQQLERHPFDLVTVDILMPEQDGFETIRAIRKDFPHMKIIAISGAASFGSYNPLEAAKLFGADRTIPKPFEPDTLLRAVHEILSTD